MSDTYTGPERRRFERVNVNLTVIYRKSQPLDVRIKTPDKETPATMVDISEGGIGVVTDLNLPVSTKLIVRFNLYNTEDRGIGYYGACEVLGQIRYNILLAPKSYRLGISFEQMDERTRLQISNFLATIRGRKDK